MTRIIATLCLLLASTCAAQIGGSAVIGGSGSYTSATLTTPALSQLQTSSDATTIVASWQSSSIANASLACGTSAGSYTNTAADSGVLAGLSQQGVVAGLLPSTTYYCQASSANAAGTGTATFSIATAAAAASTPITGLSYGAFTQYNSINGANQGNGDTYYNCRSNDGFTYLTNDDDNGYAVSGSPASAASSMSVVKFLSESPYVAQTINYLPAYGGISQPTGADGLTQKDSGLFCMAGYMFMASGRQKNPNTGLSSTAPAFLQYDGQILWSPDHGATWNNFQQVGSFQASGNATSPMSASMFAGSPSTFGSASFVMYCADDGSLGYTAACNRHDNGNAYVYLIANEGAWNGGGSGGGGNAFYLARVARAKLSRLQPGDYQFFVGGDGSLDANWSATESNATAILSNTGELGEPSIQYVPALNRYLLLTYFFPQGAGTNYSNTTWLGYESPHPWGPWTLINTTTYNGTGYYNPVVLNDTAWTGTTPTVVFSGNVTSSPYSLIFSTVTISH